jgi:hypothetical protein
VDELLGSFSLTVARESAWETAVALANARSDLERGLVTRLMDTRAAVMARLLRAPSLSPSFVAACRHLETGPACLEALAALARDRRDAAPS